MIRVRTWKSRVAAFHLERTNCISVNVEYRFFFSQLLNNISNCKGIFSLRHAVPCGWTTKLNVVVSCTLECVYKLICLKHGTDIIKAAVHNADRDSQQAVNILKNKILGAIRPSFTAQECAVNEIMVFDTCKSFRK